MLGSKVETPLLKTERWTSSESPWRRWLTQHNPFFRPRHTSLFRNLLIMGLNTAAWEQAVFILWQESNQYDQSRQRQQRASAYFCSITMQQWGEVVYSRKAWHRFFFFFTPLKLARLNCSLDISCLLTNTNSVFLCLQHTVRWERHWI